MPGKPLTFSLVKTTWVGGISTSTCIIVLTFKPGQQGFPCAHQDGWTDVNKTFQTHPRTSKLVWKWRRYSWNNFAPKSVIQTNTNKSVEYLIMIRFARDLEDMHTFIFPIYALSCICKIIIWNEDISALTWIKALTITAVLVVLILLHLFDWKEVKSTFLTHLRTSNSVEKWLSKHPSKLVSSKSATCTRHIPVGNECECHSYS